jgi:glutathionyl-hydroquinone reductase
MPKTLPPKLLIGLGKFVWTSMWKLMMSELAPRSSAGAYLRPSSQFRNTVGEPPHAIATGRYTLFVGLSCPWAHRTLILRALKGLQESISVSYVSASPLEGGWVLDQPELGCRSLSELYQLAKPGYQGRATVPVLWDNQSKTIVNNESAEIIVMLNGVFNAHARLPDVDLYPESLRLEIDDWNEKIYHAVNNGVYRCGFAQTQLAYNQAIDELFSTLDPIDEILKTQEYLCGDRLTLADVRLFTTLIRFDVAYYGIFKCNRRRIQDYPNLSTYVRRLYQLPGIAETCDLERVKRDYYGNLFPLNPGGIVPAGPDLANFLQPVVQPRE